MLLIAVKMDFIGAIPAALRCSKSIKERNKSATFCSSLPSAKSLVAARSSMISFTSPSALSRKS